MPDDQNTAQNPISEENPSPQSPKEPTEQGTENTAHSEPSTMPPEAPEAHRNSDNAIPVNNDNSIQNEPEVTSSKSESSSEIEEKPASRSETAQTPVNEPLKNETETSNEQAKPVSVNSKSSLARQLLITARNAIQFRKRKKLDRVMSLFLQQSKITNDEVEKILHVSDATATRYLSQLEKEGRIKQSGKTGAGVSYSRI